MEELFNSREGCEKDVMAVVKRSQGLEHYSKEDFLTGAKNTTLNRNSEYPLRERAAQAVACMSACC